MKPRTLTFTIAMAVIAAVAIPGTLVAQDQQHAQKLPYYVVKDLGTLGGANAVAEGISDRGWVVGDADLPGDQSVHATLWRNGVVTDLGTLGGVNSQEQWPVKDNRGLIVGDAETAAEDPFDEDFCGFDYNAGVPSSGLICVGFLWRNGVMTALPTLGGNNAQALGINNRGQAVGMAEQSTQDPNCITPQVLDIQAVVWGPKEGEIHILPPLPGDISAWGIGINDAGQVVGLSGNCMSPNQNAPGATIPRHAVVWQKGTATNIGTLGGSYTFPWAINSKGQVVGQASPPGDTTLHSFLWWKGVMTDLGEIPGDFGSVAFGLNDAGQVVGGSCDQNSDCRAFLWQDGVMTDLNTLVKPGSTPLYLFFGNDINSRGEIAFYAFDQSSGEFHAAVAIPCDANHAGVDGWEEAATDASVVPANNERPRIVLPENIRERLQKLLGFGLIGRGATTEQHNNQSNSNLVKNLDTLDGTSNLAECSSGAASDIADNRPDANKFQLWGNCAVDQTTNKLNGNCFTSHGITGRCQWGAANPQQCPVGALPKSLGGWPCSVTDRVFYDVGRRCQFY
ncbi:MAG TPA: hypothetical protein VMT53_09185 [Terriglobales bacterium]|nr:hypothetical protein [Terriglobales bacterium]